MLRNLFLWLACLSLLIFAPAYAQVDNTARGLAAAALAKANQAVSQTVPAATTTTLGTVKPDGATIGINTNGALAVINPVTLTELVAGGGVINTTGLSFASASASYYIGGSLYQAAGQTVTLATADPSNPRIDVIALDTLGHLVTITGTPAASPAVPSVDPNTQLSLTFVLVTAGATTPAGTTSENVYNLGAVWTGATSGIGLNLASSTDVTIGTTSIEGTNVASNASVTFTRSTPESLGAGNLAIYIQSKGQWANKRTLQVQFLNASGVAVGQPVTIQDGAYGFSSSNTSTVQLVVIPLANFAVPSSTQVQGLQLADKGGAIGFWINPIRIQTSTGTSNPTIPYATVNDVNTGTATSKAITPQSFAHSNFGTRVTQILVSDPNGGNLSTGTGQAYFRIGSEMAGMNLTAVAAAVITPSTSGLPTVQVQRMRGGVTTAMLSTALTINANANDSSTATTPAVISTAAQSVTTADIIRVDVTGAGTGAAGLIVSLTFSVP